MPNKSGGKSSTKEARIKSALSSTYIEASSGKARRRKPERYRSFRVHRRIKTHLPPLSGSLVFSRSALKILWGNRRLFGLLLLLYVVASLFLVRGFSASFDIPEIKKDLGSITGGAIGGVTVTASVYGVLLGTIGTVGTGQGSTYQSLLLIIMSLATIWCLRSVMSGQTVRLRDAFYKGMYPIIVFSSVLVIIGFQMLPMAIGAWLYSSLAGGSILVTGLEKVIGLILFGLLSILTLYWVASSLFALYITTIPNMTPMLALRSARQLVVHRRLTVLSRIIALLFILPLGVGVLMVPSIVFLPQISEWIFFIVSHMATIFTVTYVYLLYKELLNE